MAISRVQFASAASSGGATSITCTLSATTAGNLLVAVVAVGSTASNGTCATPSGWSLAVGPVTTESGAVSDINLYIFYKIAASGETSATFTDTVSSGITVQVWEWSATSGWPVAPLDVTASSANQASTTSPVTGTTATTAQGEELWIGALSTHYATGETYTSPLNGFTVEAVATAGASAFFAPTTGALYKTVAATGTASTGATASTAKPFAGAIATFKDTLGATLTRSVPTSAALQATGVTRQIAVTAALDAPGVVVVTPATSALAQPVAEYAIRVRNAARQIVGEISQYTSAGFTLRHNNVSTWMIELDANDPLAGALTADGAGIQVLRVLRDPATGARLSGGVLLSGPRWGRVRQMNGRTLIASGYDDLVWLQGRLAYPVASYPYANTVLALPGLLRYYRLGESTGTSAVDAKSAQNGTYTGGYTLGTAGGIDDPNTAVTLNGTTGWVTLPTTSLPTGNGAWTMGAWVNPSALPAASTFGLALYIGTQSAGQLATIGVYNNAGTLQAGVDTSGANVIAGNMTLNTWAFLCATYDGTTLRLYLNGVETGNIAPTARNLVMGAARIGGNPNTGTQLYTGVVDEAFIGNTALSAANVANVYATGISRFANAAYDTRTGVAETVIRQYVDTNAVSAIANPLGQSRVVSGLTLDTDAGRGSTVTGNARFDQLLVPDGTGLLQQLAQSGGMGFRVTQSGTSLVFSQYVPANRTASVIFSDALGNLADFTYQEDGPDFSQGGNAIIVGGGGQGTARVFIARNDATSISRWGVFEGFADARDTSDTATLQQRGDALLAQASVQTQFACTLAPQRALVYGQDFNVGDSVTVVMDGVSFTNIVREVQITLDTAGAETIVPAVGTPNADTIRNLFGGYVQQQQLTALHTTANRLARSQ